MKLVNLFLTAAAVLMLAGRQGWCAEGRTSVVESQAVRWARSVVTIEVARKQYDFMQPWNTRNSGAFKSGVVVGGAKEILTTAEGLYDRTLVRLQKHGTGEWWIGEVTWLDYHANLALITATVGSFWDGLEPVALGPVNLEGPMQIGRWRQGNLELRRAEFTRYFVGRGTLSDINQIILNCDSDVTGAGGGEPLMANGHCAGLLTEQSGRFCSVLPASLIQSVLEARRAGTFTGLGYFHWFWQPAANPDLLAHLKLSGKPRGVVVSEIPERQDGLKPVMKVGDVVLRIEDFEVDTMGNYQDPEYGRVLLENLASRGKWAGNKVRILISREGKEMEVEDQLPKYEFANALVPAARYDAPPEYVIVGGLVFQPLTDEFLQSWGTDWDRKAPFRLMYYRSQPRTKERPGLLILSQILPDPFNIGYQEQRLLVVDKVNGRPVSRLVDLREAFEKPVGGFNVVEFTAGETLQRMVLEAGDAQREATARVLKRYGIRSAEQLCP